MAANAAVGLESSFGVAGVVEVVVVGDRWIYRERDTVQKHMSDMVSTSNTSASTSGHGITEQYLMMRWF